MLGYVRDVERCNPEVVKPLGPVDALPEELVDPLVFGDKLLLQLLVHSNAGTGPPLDENKLFSPHGKLKDLLTGSPES